MTLPVTAFISPGSSEFLLIMLVLILLFGAKDAPRMFRTLHTALDKIQRAAASFRYKIMYGDLHQSASDETPYDVDDLSPDTKDAGDDKKTEVVPPAETDTNKPDPS